MRERSGDEWRARSVSGSKTSTSRKPSPSITKKTRKASRVRVPDADSLQRTGQNLCRKRNVLHVRRSAMSSWTTKLFGDGQPTCLCVPTFRCLTGAPHIADSSRPSMTVPLPAWKTSGIDEPKHHDESGGSIQSTISAELF